METIDDGLLASAAEHRMTGLLWTWAQTYPVDPAAARSWLAIKDLQTRSHLARLWGTLVRTVRELDAAGIQVATLKGVTAEARWYQRPGERPCSDVDLLLSPHQLDRAAEAVAILQPNHPWLPDLAQLVSSGRIQTVTTRVDGVEVDFHLDLLKLGIRTRGAAEVWERTAAFPLSSGLEVRVLDDTSALLHFLVHLNKDRFQRLLGLADIPRVLANGQVDWVLLRRLAGNEGIEVSVLRTLETVVHELDLSWPDAVRRPTGTRARVWSMVWPTSMRLRGREGRLRFRMRQWWIAILARARTREAIWSWLREGWPPSEIVNARYAHIRGPYVWKLVRGRWERATTRRSILRARWKRRSF